jgi:predicted nucleic acid-binding protein
MAVFLDTSYILALVNTADEYHQRASKAALEARGPFVTTEAVLTEIGNSLARLRWRSLGVAALEDCAATLRSRCFQSAQSCLIGQ